MMLVDVSDWGGTKSCSTTAGGVPLTEFAFPGDGASIGDGTQFATKTPATSKFTRSREWPRYRCDSSLARGSFAGNHCGSSNQLSPAPKPSAASAHGNLSL